MRDCDIRSKAKFTSVEAPIRKELILKKKIYFDKVVINTAWVTSVCHPQESKRTTTQNWDVRAGHGIKQLFAETANMALANRLRPPESYMERMFMSTNLLQHHKVFCKECTTGTDCLNIVSFASAMACNPTWSMSKSGVSNLHIGTKITDLWKDCRSAH